MGSLPAELHLSPRTASFLAFSVFSVVSLVAGYAARRRGWLREELSKPIHFHTVVWCWSLAAMLSIWRMPIRVESLWLGAVQPIIMTISALSMIPIAKLVRCSQKQIGVLAIGAGLSNTGFTLGAYLCYSLLRPPELALAYSIAYVPVTHAMMVLLIFPLARHFGKKPGDSAGRLRELVTSNFFDLRALPMYASLAGVSLGALGVPFPEEIDRWHLIDVLFYIGGFGGYFGIGLLLRLGDSRAYLKQHTILAMMKFVVMPAVAWAILSLIQLTPRPLDPLAQQVVLIQASVPTAILTVMLSNMFHLDARMASTVWVCNTLIFTAAVLPVILWVLS